MEILACIFMIIAAGLSRHYQTRMIHEMRGYKASFCISVAQMIRTGIVFIVANHFAVLILDSQSHCYMGATLIGTRH